MTTRKIIDRAIETAYLSEYKYKLGAVLFKGNSILRCRPNNTKFISFYKKYHKNPSRHAEIAVMKDIPADILCGSEILVVRVLSNGNLSCAKPCNACIRYATIKRIKKIYFSDWDGKIKCIKL